MSIHLSFHLFQVFYQTSAYIFGYILNLIMNIKSLGHFQVSGFQFDDIYITFNNYGAGIWTESSVPL